MRKLREEYVMTGANLKKARNRKSGKKVKHIPMFKVGDFALLK